MAKTGNSKYYPQNTSVLIPDLEKRAELFWQTVNANHLLENYVDKITHWGKDHDLKFNDFKKLLSGNTYFKIEKSTKGYAIAYDASKKNYYFVKFVLHERFKKLFVIIVTAYATKYSQHLKEYNDYQKWVEQKFAAKG